MQLDLLERGTLCSVGNQRRRRLRKVMEDLTLPLMVQEKQISIWNPKKIQKTILFSKKLDSCGFDFIKEF
jgi:hypothetical protein